jgi:hypothetical protein
MVYIVAYDLKEPSSAADYARIIEAIKSYGTWLRLEQNVWMIESAKTHVQVRDELLTRIRAYDTIFVGRMSAAAWTTSLDEERKKWLADRKTWS